MDKDLQSIQEVRDLIAKAKAASAILADFSQEQLDAIVKAVAVECEKNAVTLAKMAEEETRFGNWQDKTLKNLLGSAMTYDYIKDMPTHGILSEDKAKGIIEIGVPMGIVAALIPSTNPTSTAMHKAIISLKAGNSIIFSPHPNAKKCITETVKIVTDAARRAGAPEGAIGCISLTTMQATETLLKSRDIGIILATGGEAMVRAAYSSGNPAIGVGPGNGPAYIEKTADIPLAIKRIFDSKTFDNGTVCASEQSIVTERSIEGKVVAEVERQGGYFLNEEQSQKLAAFLLRDNGTMNPVIVGKSAKKLAEIAGLDIPHGVKVLLSKQTEVSKKNPYSREKLCPILAFYVEENWQTACERCMEILHNEGIGHTMVIHTKDDNLVKTFALKKPVSRLLVNTAGALGGVGCTTNLAPSLTLGCGSAGGSATSDNITPLNLFNIRRVAYGVREAEDIRAKSPIKEQKSYSANEKSISGFGKNEQTDAAFTAEDIDRITKAVLAR
ncbi:MAG: acetaldehyde dehydrogenase (acetylating), partial [Clostridia bacterium]|nr:acetaldehyde dehydrogenase (acetylating) [Clostridia bacterium]